MDCHQTRIHEQLNTLIEFSAIINSTLDLQDLMDIVMQKAKTEMQAEACSILFYNRETNKLEFELAICTDECTSEILKNKIEIELGQGIAGWVALNQKPLYVDDVSKDERFYKGVDKTTGFVTQSIIAVPLIGRRGLIGVVEIINPVRKDYDRTIFQTLCKQFAIAIENAMLYKESLQKERLRQQIEIASQIQRSFLPEQNIFTKGAITAKAINIPAYSIGGDLYDFVDIDETKGEILIGDIAGKGISAALYMAKIMSDFRHIRITHKSAEDTIYELNKVVAKAPMGMFLTATYVCFDSTSTLIKFINSANPPLIKIDHLNLVTLIEDISGPPLGIMDYYYPASYLELKPSERLFLITDGVIDATNVHNQRLGLTNILEFLRQAASSENLFDDFVNYILDYCKDQELVDDITIVQVARS